MNKEIVEYTHEKRLENSNNYLNSSKCYNMVFFLNKINLLTDFSTQVIDLVAITLGIIKEWLFKDKTQDALESIIEQNKKEEERIQKENEVKHLIQLRDNFFNPLLRELEKKENNKYFKIGSIYSDELKKMIPLKPIELSNIKFSDEILNNPDKYTPLLNDWEELKNTTIKINKTLANFFEELRIVVTNKINLSYWCPESESDEPFKGYVCYTTFIKAIYDEVEYKLSHSKKKQFYGSGEVKPRTIGTKNEWYFQWGNDLPLAVSLEQKQIDDVKSLFRWIVENEQYKQKIKVILNTQTEKYDIALEKVMQDIQDILKPIELENIAQPIFINPYAGI